MDVPNILRGHGKKIYHHRGTEDTEGAIYDLPLRGRQIKNHQPFHGIMVLILNTHFGQKASLIHLG